MIKIKIILILSLSISIVQSSLAQFQKTFGTNSDDYSQLLLQSDKNHFYLIGANTFISKIDTLGNFLWEKELKTKIDFNYNTLSDAINTDSTHFLVLGAYHNMGGYYDNIFVSKFNSNGDTVWTQTYYNNSLKSCVGNRIIPTRDGGYAIIGNGSLYDGGNNDILLIKTDSAGKALWSKTYGATGSEDGVAIAETDAGDFIIAGYTTGHGEGFQDIYLLKTNNIGDTIWTKTLGGNRNDTPSDIIKSSANEYLIAGVTSSYETCYHDDDLFLMKIDNDGNIKWLHTYGGEKNESASRLFKTKDSSILVMGSTQSFGAGQNDIFLIKTNSMGDTIYSKVYGGSSNDYGISIAEASDSYYILGDTRSFSVGGYDMCLIRVNSKGISSCRYKEANPIISTPDWIENKGKFGSILESNFTAGNSKYSITNQTMLITDMCSCIPPTALFTYGAMDGSVTFNDLSRWADSWSWDFGDGRTSNEQNPICLITQETNVCLTVKNGCGTQTYCEKVYGGGGFKENYTSQLIALTPNPASDIIRFSNLPDTHRLVIELLDLKGSKLIKAALSPTQNVLNISTLDKGLYIYLISTENGIIQTGRFVKK